MVTEGSERERQGVGGGWVECGIRHDVEEGKDQPPVQAR